MSKRRHGRVKLAPEPRALAYEAGPGSPGVEAGPNLGSWVDGPKMDLRARPRGIAQREDRRGPARRVGRKLRRHLGRGGSVEPDHTRSGHSGGVAPGEACSFGPDLGPLGR